MKPISGLQVFQPRAVRPSRTDQPVHVWQYVGWHIPDGIYFRPALTLPEDYDADKVAANLWGAHPVDQAVCVDHFATHEGIPVEVLMRVDNNSESDRPHRIQVDILADGTVSYGEQHEEHSEATRLFTDLAARIPDHLQCWGCNE